MQEKPLSYRYDDEYSYSALNNPIAYNPAAHRRAGSLRSVYVGERWHKHKGGLSN
jgi:hypothetical protein